MRTSSPWRTKMCADALRTRCARASSAISRQGRSEETNTPGSPSAWSNSASLLASCSSSLLLMPASPVAQLLCTSTPPGGCGRDHTDPLRVVAYAPAQTTGKVGSHLGESREKSGTGGSHLGERWRTWQLAESEHAEYY